ncbi:MAG TPA: COX15/CtaA family protein [Stellaceae bacterium]|nr:COX15/CtaA family protein [Stellaceae bacterium]
MTSIAPSSPSFATASAARGDRGIALWLFGCAAMIFLMVVIGGVTRLTESGLSITEWQPIAGVIPPLSDADWAREFDHYRAIPQYQAIHAGMTLAEFKTIFFWEYLHRLWGRLIGVAFAAPFLWCLVARRLSWALAPKLAVLLVLGGLQGALGWYMVESGLADRIEVSQYRLVAHLAAAVALYLAILWVALDLSRPLTLPLLRSGPLPLPPERGRGASSMPAIPSPTKREREGPSAERWEGEGASPTPLRRALTALLVLTLLTLAAGGFVAGLRAGYVYNTFPLMNGYVVPPDYATASPWYLNPFESLAAAQFDHRVLAELTWLWAIGVWVWSLRLDLAREMRAALHALAAVATLQLGLGVATLVLVVPIPLAVAHQAGALLLVTAALVARHAARRPEMDGLARAAL